MRSKTSCFNAAVYRKALSRWWPLWAGAALILFFYLPFSMANIRLHGMYGDMDAAQTVYEIAVSSTDSLPLITCLYGLVFSAATFGYLFKTRSASMMAALPLKREGVFCSHFLAGLTMLLSSGLLAALLAAGFTLSKGQQDLTGVLAWLGVYAAQTVTFYGIGVFCAMLTGQALVLPCLYVLVNFGGAILSALLGFMAQLLLVGVPRGQTLSVFRWLTYLSPCPALLTETGVRYLNAYDAPYVGFEGWRIVLIYLAVGVALAVLSLVLYKRRNMETAQEPVTMRWLGPVLKYIVTFFCALGLPAMIILFFGGGAATSTAGLLVFTALGAAIGYLISEMILHKSVRIRRRSWLGVLLAAAAAFLIMGAMKLDVFGYVHRVPDPAEVEHAEFKVFQDLNAKLTDADVIAELTDIHRELIEVQEPDLYGGVDLQVTYHLKNGRSLMRSYSVPDDGSEDGPAQRLIRLASDSEVFDAGQEPLHEVTGSVIEYAEISWNEPAPGDPYEAFYSGAYVNRQFSEKEALDLFENGILPDLEAGVFPHTFNGRTLTLPSDALIRYQLYWEDTGSQNLNYQLTPDCTHTLAWLAAHGYEIPGVE